MDAIALALLQQQTNEDGHFTFLIAALVSLSLSSGVR
jgi:hypothetical protein